MLQQIVLTATDYVNRNEMEKIDVPAGSGKVEGELIEHDMRFLGGTADIETRQLLIIKCCL